MGTSVSMSGKDTVNPSNKWTRDEFSKRLRSYSIPADSQSQTLEFKFSSSPIHQMQQSLLSSTDQAVGIASTSQLPSVSETFLETGIEEGKQTLLQSYHVDDKEVQTTFSTSSETDRNLNSDDGEDSQRQLADEIQSTQDSVSADIIIDQGQDELNDSLLLEDNANFLVSHTGHSENDSSEEVENEFENNSSDDEKSMASMALMPVHFRGLSTEDPIVWWGDVEHYCEYRKLTNEERKGLVPLLLKEGARHWFNSLQDGQKDTFVHIGEAFLQQYKRDEAYKWSDSADVWATHQLPDQSVDDYISVVLKKCNQS